jgi:eukaryotic-like serine/threonine-protein kinase
MPFMKKLFGEPAPLEAGAAFASRSTYRLTERLGRGGMGEVWKAERTSAGGHAQIVAVKFLTGASSGEAALAAEALRMSRLCHDNIVQYLDSGVDEAGRLFVAMTFVEGMDLDKLRLAAGIDSARIYTSLPPHRIPEQIVGFIAFMTLRALEHAHTFDFGGGVIGLVHRDVSPGNILLDVKRGFVKLSDFGVAAVLEDVAGAGQITGKVPYMAPEVLVGDPVDARSDLYALGLVLYELLTGFNPNMRPTMAHSVIGAITEVMLSLEKPLRPPHGLVVGVDEELSLIVTKLLSRAPEGRYASAGEALEALGACLFNHGFGPTTTSLADYLALLAGPPEAAAACTVPSLRFLACVDGVRTIRPPWRLTPEAAAAVAEGKNPGRVG